MLTFAPEIPRSVRTFARNEARRLGLADWSIEIKLCRGKVLDKYHKSNQVQADVVVEVAHRSASIDLRESLPVAEQKRNIAHELEHLVISPLDLLVRQAWRKKLTWPQLSEIWGDAVETLIESKLNAREW
jgi:hypothetical protein